MVKSIIGYRFWFKNYVWEVTGPLEHVHAGRFYPVKRVASEEWQRRAATARTRTLEERTVRESVPAPQK